MKIQPFIINWPHQYDKVRTTEKEFLSIFQDCTVINADRDISAPGWVSVGYGYGRQIAKILELFKQSGSDILFILTGDATSKSWLEIIESAKEAYKKYKWGIFLPFIDTSSWNNKSFSDIDSSLRLMKNSDGVAWLIHKDIVDYYMLNCMHAFKRNFLGWGIDIAMTSTSWFMKRPVIQDKRYIVNHPRGCGYDRSEAIRQEKASYSIMTPDYIKYNYLLRGKDSCDLAEFICLEDIKLSLL